MMVEWKLDVIGHYFAKIPGAMAITASMIPRYHAYLVVRRLESGDGWVWSAEYMQSHEGGVAPSREAGMLSAEEAGRALIAGLALMAS